jgi:hypothetical protein
MRKILLAMAWLVLAQPQAIAQDYIDYAKVDAALDKCVKAAKKFDPYFSIKRNGTSDLDISCQDPCDQAMSTFNTCTQSSGIDSAKDTRAPDAYWSVPSGGTLVPVLPRRKGD